ncbi:MAG: sensor histidine kinase, partial [Methylocystaceae bacterium]
HGLLGMRERIAAFGGSFSISRAARGTRGICVAARIPLIASGPSARMERMAA